jgi:methylmalonyl-CoA mutase
VLGGTQSLHTNSFDEAIALPTEFSARIARNTQLILAEESSVTHVADPLAGSYYVESLTQSIIEEARKLMREVDALGGMTKAIAAGLPKQKIEESAARRQAAIDQGKFVIVGVNKYRLDKEDALEIRDVDNVAVREGQVRRLEQIRATRDTAAVNAALEELAARAASGEGNLLEAAVDASRKRATVGEISDAMERAFKRYEASVATVSGVYRSEYGDNAEVKDFIAEVDAFAEKHGRRPRMLVCKLGQDGHDRGARIIASAFADLGFDVDMGPLFQTPQEAAKQAIENDVHVVGVSSLAAGHKTLVPQLIDALRKEGADDILVVAGGVIPHQDYDALYAAGVKQVFGPGTNIVQAAKKVLADIEAGSV